MVRVYGNPPYMVVMVHGGPGAIGSLKSCAEEFSRIFGIGVIEPLQSKYSIGELVDELYQQIKENYSQKVVLIGHSWGAWLVALTAEKYPETVEKIILTGCPPIEDKYVEEISNIRLKNLSGSNREIFDRLINNKANDSDMEKIPEILEKSDNFCLLNNSDTKAKTDSIMYNKVWSEAEELRTSKKLLSTFVNIKAEICLIQGEKDPHPAKGVTEPLENAGICCKSYILKKCGHAPFMEKYVKDDFYKILYKNVSTFI